MTTSLVLLLILGGSAARVARAARRAGADGRRRAADASSRSELQQRDHLHVRHLRPQARRRVHVLARPSRCARKSRALVGERQDARSRSSSTSSNKYGSQEVLASPIDKGFNRLAWMLPYAVGAARHRCLSAAWRCAGRAARPSAGATAPRRLGAARTRGCASTTNSATSTDELRRPRLPRLAVLPAAVDGRRDRRGRVSPRHAPGRAAAALERGRARRRPGRRSRSIARCPGSSARAAAGAARPATLRDDLEREKALVLRSIKELEFDHAMGKVSDADFAELRARLRARALDADGGARARAGRRRRSRRPRRDEPGPPRRATPASATDAPRLCAACQTANDGDARFCKQCGAQAWRRERALRSDVALVSWRVGVRRVARRQAQMPNPKEMSGIVRCPTTTCRSARSRCASSAAASTRTCRASRSSSPIDGRTRTVTTDAAGRAEIA